ncbi:MAG: FAD-dependent oxidoreductase, partial [Myxococcota bacterium]
NMGPHALYLSGAAMRALRELGIDLPGKSPATSGGLAYCAGKLHALPDGALSLLTTGLLGPGEKLELGRLLARVPRIDAAAETGCSLDEFLAREVRSVRVRDVVLAIVRVTSYSNAPRHVSAGAALEQLALGLGGGVRYLDGGWQRMVDSLLAAARAAGVTLRCGVRIERVVHDGAARGVVLAAGERLAADAVVLALGPVEASALLDAGTHPFFTRASTACVPVRAACLDLGLSRLPAPRRLFALGIERPLYYSVHSAAASLAPEGSALIQLARYLGPGEDPRREEIEAELEGMLDVVQPGWRECVVARRLMRELTVTHDLPQAAHGGLAGRTPGQVTGVANLWLAGDWIGPTGMLADAAFASAQAAARGAASARGVRVAA